MSTALTQIFVSGLEVQASIGVHPHEHESTQPLIIDIRIDMGSLPAPEDDRLGETFDYSRIADRIAEEAHVQLVETLAHRIAIWALNADMRIQKCWVKISKPHALINANAAGVEVSVVRDGHT